MKGEVTLVTEYEVQVVIDQACAKGQCATCNCCGGAPAARLELKLAPDLAVAPGDQVEVDVNLPNPAVAALIMFGIPFFDAVLGALLGRLLGGGQDWPLLLGGGLGLVFGFGEVAVLDRLVLNSRRRCRLLRKLPS